eukprot:COSAG04_NODE_192_length_20873_cov_26.172957_12_plen_1541_part_00
MPAYASLGADSSGPAAEKDWAQMTAAEQKAAGTLGWTEASWTAGDTEPLLKPWCALARHEQAAAERMGYAEDDFGDFGSHSAEGEEVAPGSPLPEPERARLVSDAESSNAAGLERDSGRGESRKKVQPPRKSGRCVRCQDRWFELREYKIRGFRLLDFLKLLGSLALPTSDAWLDWSVIIKWYLGGDVHWAETGLAINLVSGTLSGLLLASMLHEKLENMDWSKAVPLGLLVGLAGLAPVGFAALILHLEGHDDNSGLQQMKQFKALELVFEALPQSILQCATSLLRLGTTQVLIPSSCCCRTYVGVAYGRFNPSSPKFSNLLPVSVFVSLLGAGSTAFGFEASARDEYGKFVDLNSTRRRLPLGSPYGIVALLLRTAQATALIFWIALTGCAYKGWAGLPMLLAVAIFGWMVYEAAFLRSDVKSEFGETVWTALTLSAVHLTLLGSMAAAFFGDEQDEGWVGAAVLLTGMLLVCGGCLCAGYDDDCEKFFGCSGLLTDSDNKVYAVGCALLTLISMSIVFFNVEHVDNNYANKSMPVGGPGSGSGPDDPQYFDCHERTSGLYPAYLASALCVVLTPLYAALDPAYGLEGMWGKGWAQKTAEAEAKMRAEVQAKLRAEAIRKESEADAPLEEQMEALWKWAEGTAGEDGKRWLSTEEITEAAVAAGMEHGALCELLRVVEREPILGPRAVLGGRVGAVTEVGTERDEATKIRISGADVECCHGFGPEVVENELSCAIVATDPPCAESDLANAAALRGKLALTHRGECTFPEKANRAAEAGAVALIVVNNEPGNNPLRPGDPDDEYKGGIPVLGVSAGVGARLVAATEECTLQGPHEVVTGKIQVRWEDDGTESPWLLWIPEPGRFEWPDDTIRVSDLDEPLGEGSAVRHNGRRGTAATEPKELYGKGECIKIRWEQIRWEDDGTVSSWIKVSELDVEVRVGRESFVAACTQHPERTTKMYLHATRVRDAPMSDIVPLHEQMRAVYAWASGTLDNHGGFYGGGELKNWTSSSGYGLKNWMSVRGIKKMANAVGMEHDTLRELLGVVEREPIRGPLLAVHSSQFFGDPDVGDDVVEDWIRAGRTHRLGRVIARGHDDRHLEKGKVRIRWEEVSRTETPELVLGGGRAADLLSDARFINGVTVVLGYQANSSRAGDVGTVIKHLRSPHEELASMIQVRWENGIESPGPDQHDRWPDDAIRVSDLEPLSEGSFVRHNGRRGTAATEPPDFYGGDTIKIRWEDDGTLSDWIKVSELDVEVDTSASDFFASQNRERTTKMYLYLAKMHGVPACEKMAPDVRRRAQAMRDALAMPRRQADTAVMEAKIEAVWRWADNNADGTLNRTELDHLAAQVGSEEATAREKYEEMCTALGLHASAEDASIDEAAFRAACHTEKFFAAQFKAVRIRGPRAVLGGRVGTAIERAERGGEEAIRVRWEDNGTESPWIEMSDLDEPLGEGSAVRHNGRRGTVVMEPGKRVGDEANKQDNMIQIRWQDDGTVSDRMSELVSQLDVLGSPVEVWFERLRLPLLPEEEEPGCLDELLVCL